MDEMNLDVENVKKQMEELRRLKIAGVEREPGDLGPIDVLWLKYEDGERWELLPRWVADLVVSNLHEVAGVRGARLYRVPPPKGAQGSAESVACPQLDKT